MKKVILLSSVLLAAPFMLGEIGEASAQCTTTPSCSSLGYTSGVNTGNCLKCPTGNYYFCPPKIEPSCDSSYKYTCTGTGYTGGSGEECGRKYKQCDCAAGYTWNGTACEPGAILGQCTGYAKNCKIGDILNSDGTCTSGKVSGKNPIGVTIYVGDNNGKTCGWAIALTDESIANVRWSFSTYRFDRTTLGRGMHDSCKNTQHLLNAAEEDGGVLGWSFDAASVAYNYAPTAAPETKGKWCLPSVNLLNAKLGSGFPDVYVGKFFNALGFSTSIWTSTLSKNTQYAACFYMINPGAYSIRAEDDGCSVTDGAEVLPVIEFQNQNN